MVQADEGGMGGHDVVLDNEVGEDAEVVIGV